MDSEGPVDLKARFAVIQQVLALPVKKGFLDALENTVGPDFEKECPVIYQMLKDPRAHPRLRSMLDMAVSVDKGDVAQHDASVRVGETLVNDFVKGQIRR
jgi:hypothetical protein